MAKRRKDDEQEYDYTETQTQPSDAEFTDSEPAQDEAVEESGPPAAPTSGGPQKYRVEQSAPPVRGQNFEAGELVTLKPEEAQRLAASGVQLSWTPEDQEPEAEPEPEAYPAESEPAPTTRRR